MKKILLAAVTLSVLAFGLTGCPTPGTGTAGSAGNTGNSSSTN